MSATALLIASDLAEMDPQQEALVIRHAAAQGLGELRARGADASPDLVGKAFGIVLARRQSIEDRAPAGPDDVGENGAELEIGGL
jgi:hypothetical protein